MLTINDQIKINNLSKVFKEGKQSLTVLNNININIKKGEFISITGPSGSGKSTLMNIIGLLDTPSTGTLIIDEQPINSKTKINRLAKIRRHSIGFVFQTFNLLPRISALENVLLPMIYAGLKNKKIKAKKLLEQVGLANRMYHKPSELSGGERQRVAIARALANNPEIILADEPTGNLDSKSGNQIIFLLKKLNQNGKTLIIVTHDQSIAKQSHRLIRLKDGELI